MGASALKESPAVKKMTKELHELYRIRAEMERAASSGSECDAANLKWAQQGIVLALKKLDELRKRGF